MCREMVVVCVGACGFVVCEVGLCSLLRVAVARGVSLCWGHDVGKGAGAGPKGEVRVVLMCYVFCISACSVSVTAGILVL
jgi:hypothetical protein